MTKRPKHGFVNLDIPIVTVIKSKKEKEDLKETADKQNSLTKFFYEVAIEELDEVEEKIKTLAKWVGESQNIVF